ncbi:ammonium transporter [Altericista sp. CCNU0014]|uniref:ammonium transporter n=1 Tax=Altericista sp. CCNU0014 TaxID=3082949 RepID=UPI00384BDC02
MLFGTACAAIATPTETDLLAATQKMQQDLKVMVDTLWVVFASSLVFFMNAGFAMLEAGFCRSKNAANLLTKNLIVFALTTVAFWSIGFGLMFGFGGDWSNPAASDNGVLGLHGFFLNGADNSPLAGQDYRGVYRAIGWAGIPLQAKFFFQLVFAGTAATIVSGAVAERIKFLAFVLFSIFLTGIAYPIVGHWIWGGGWLFKQGFWDFAGSTVVHSVGGWSALIGAILLGPRIGKYKDGESLALPGHNLSLSTLGCFILWLGWFGFNAGSTLSLEPSTITHILVVTNFAAAMGGITSMATAWLYFGKPDLSVMINGILGGLVSVTAACRFVNIGSAAFIGSIAGILIIIAVDMLDRWNIDDPVGAVSVHLVCGIWGTAAVGLFAVGARKESSFHFVPYLEGPRQGLFVGGGLEGINQLLVQLLGIATVGLFTVLTSWAIWSLLKTLVGLRVTKESELRGLDLSEHGLQAYSGFMLKSDITAEPYEE